MRVLALTPLWLVAFTPTARANSAPFYEHGWIQLEGAAAAHHGWQTQPDVAYQGVTEGDVGLSGSLFSDGWWGFHFSAEGERLSLSDSTPLVKTVLFRARVGPSARFLLGPLRFEGFLGYGYARIIAFNAGTELSFAPVNEQQAIVGLRMLAPLFLSFLGELSLEAPWTFSASNAGGAAHVLAGRAGAAVLFPLTQSHPVSLLGGLEYAIGEDRASLSGGSTAVQIIQQFGLFLRLHWREAQPLARGALAVEVLSAEGDPMSNAQLEWAHDGRTQSLTADEKGHAFASDLSPGRVTVRASAPGMLSSEAEGDISAGQELKLQLKLKKEPPKVGGLVLTVVDKQTLNPLVGAKVTLGARTETTSDQGQVRAEDLPPGPISIAVTAPGYQTLQDAAVVVAGKSADVALALVSEAKKIPAVLSGIVRSTSEAAPVAAMVEIRELHIRTRTNPSGYFVIHLNAGIYTLVVSAPGYVSQTKNVVVKNGDETIYNIDLHPELHH